MTILPSAASKIDLFFCLSTMGLVILSVMVISQHIRMNQLVRKVQYLPDQKDIDDIRTLFIEQQLKTMADFNELHKLLRSETNDC